MNIEMSKASVGKMVMSIDPFEKMVRFLYPPHGPYKLIKITKAGLAILEGREDYRIAPSLLELFPIDEIKNDSICEDQPIALNEFKLTKKIGPVYF